MSQPFSVAIVKALRTRLVELTCHFLTRDRSLSVVMSIPWKFVRRFLPCTSSDMRRNFLNATSSFCRSASDTSKTRPLSPSLASSTKGQGCYHVQSDKIFLLLPWVLFTKVLPMFLTANIAGALTSYHSFLVYGSMLQFKEGPEEENGVNLHIILRLAFTSTFLYNANTVIHLKLRCSTHKCPINVRPSFLCKYCIYN